MDQLEKRQHVRLDLEQANGVRQGGYDSEACKRVRRAQHAPLGLYLSYGAAKTIAASAQFRVDDLMPKLGVGRKQALERIKPAK